MRAHRQKVAVPAPQRGETCALIVSYHPDPEFRERVASIRAQAGGVLIIDNGSTPLEREMLFTLSRSIQAPLILNEENEGIAAALNQGFRWARDKGFRWVLSLDQDSLPSERLLETLVRVYEEYPRKEDIAVIGSFYWIEKNRKGIHADRSWLEQKAVITSGSLFPISIYEVLGPFREDFFIDHVDHEYCLRARRTGYKILAAKEIPIRHAIGSPTRHAVLGRRYDASNHPPLRRYYQARNLLILAREYWTFDPSWVWSSICLHLIQTILILLFEDRKAEKMKSTFLGIYDGILGRTGKRHDL